MMADQMASTPSPTASANGNGNMNTPATTVSNSSNSASRRPPRKSTLTQQQKNQKRQRATQEQLVLLEVEFNKNPTPTAAVRERIATEINMTERSVQIWFQNRRAKIKLLAKKSIETGEDCDSIPESYRQYLAMQAMESGKPIAGNFMGPIGGYNRNLLMGGDSHSPQKVVIHHFQCRSLTIGSWRRVGQNAMDLVIFYSLGDKPSLTYYINNESAGYKIEFPFSYIKNISLENQQHGDGPDARYAGLLVELNRPPNFFMDNQGSGGFNQCGDFTEDQQASKIMVHHLGGDPRVLSGQLAKLSLLDSFQNRHMASFMDTNIIAASAPVSPVGHRPASQPNAPAQNQMRFPEHAFGHGLHPAARIHKRTRSRSVPAITDMSFLSQPMPSFHVQHPSTNITDPSIFAPIPQHSGHLGTGAPLRINTAPGYGIDFRQYGPMSAATTGSPSEYASPGFYGPGSDVEGMPSAGFQPSYNMPFMSPMQEHAHSIQPSVSPLSAISHGDPVIADQSPPLANMHRSASADFLSMPQEHSNSIVDDNFQFEDIYGKHNLNLPFRTNGIDDAQFDMSLHEDPTGEAIDGHLYSNNTIDPSALNSEHHGL